MNTLADKKKSNFIMGDSLLSLGEIYVSDFLAPGQEPGFKHELELVMDESIGAARLKTTAPLITMFEKYWYRSGTNESMKAALKDIVDSILPFVGTKGIWLDIAANDGTLLSFVPGYFKIAIDPCEDNIKYECLKHVHIHEQDYFTKKLYKELWLKPGFPPVNIITTIAMFYDLEDPDTFIKDVYEVMEDEGLWVLQLSYTPLMLKQLAFDNILSEHVYYHTLGSMKILMERNGFNLVDCQLNDVNGGSMRVFVRKQKADIKKFSTQCYRDVCDFRIASILSEEKNMRMQDKETWAKFYRDIVTLKNAIIYFIGAAKANGKTIMGYGASTKGNTLLQFFGLDHTVIDAIAEKQSCKWGLRTVGTNIPIISEEEMRERKPDYLLVLPWHFQKEFIEREKQYLKAGGKMIFPLPKFEII